MQHLPKKINNTDYMAQITLHILMTRFFAAYSDNNNGHICLIHQKTSCTAYSTHSGALFYYLLGLLEASVSGSTCLCCILYHSFILILKCWVTSGMGHDVFWNSLNKKLHLFQDYALKLFAFVPSKQTQSGIVLLC